MAEVVKIEPKKRMTRKQAKLIQVMHADPTISAPKAMVKAGYSESSAKTPQIFLRALSIQDQADEAGLTNNLIMASLADDIVSKPRRRVQELTLAAKIKGLLVDKLHVQHDLGASFDIPPEEQAAIVDIL